MSVRRVGSLFSRSIKTTFNNNKYANLTARGIVTQNSGVDLFSISWW